MVLNVCVCTCVEYMVTDGGGYDVDSVSGWRDVLCATGGSGVGNIVSGLEIERILLVILTYCTYSSTERKFPIVPKVPLTKI